MKEDSSRRTVGRFMPGFPSPQSRFFFSLPCCVCASVRSPFVSFLLSSLSLLACVAALFYTVKTKYDCKCANVTLKYINCVLCVDCSICYCTLISNAMHFHSPSLCSDFRTGKVFYALENIDEASVIVKKTFNVVWIRHFNWKLFASNKCCCATNQSYLTPIKI